MVDKKTYNAAEVEEKLRMLRSFVETDQKTVDALAARLSLIVDLLKEVAQQLEKTKR